MASWYDYDLGGEAGGTMGLAGFVLVVSRTEQVSGRDRRNGKRYGAVSMGIGIGGGGGRRSWSVCVREGGVCCNRYGRRAGTGSEIRL